MSIMIGMPCYGGNVSDKTAVSLFNLGKVLVRNNIDHGLLVTANESLISRGRSRIANYFLNNTEFDYLFFLDSDIGFDPLDLVKMYNYKLELVSGPYPMKTIPLKWNYTISEPIKTNKPLIAIDRIGIGFTLIHRKVFQAIIDKFGTTIKYVPMSSVKEEGYTEKECNNSYHFFSELKMNNTYLPEDLSFFERSKLVGIQPWMDTSVHLSHVGSYVFKE